MRSLAWRTVALGAISGLIFSRSRTCNLRDLKDQVQRELFVPFGQTSSVFESAGGLVGERAAGAS